jgi:hypothetical protein
LCVSRIWRSALVSSQPLRVFGAALSPDQLSEQTCGPPSRFELRRTPASAKASPAEALAKAGGADGGNRNRVFGVALRGLTFQLHPHGWWEAERIELPAAKGLRLQRSDGTSRPYWRFPKSHHFRPPSLSELRRAPASAKASPAEG